MSDSLFQLRDIFSLEVVLLQLYSHDLLSLLHIEDFVQVLMHLMPIIVKTESFVLSDNRSKKLWPKVILWINALNALASNLCNARNQLMRGSIWESSLLVDDLTLSLRRGRSIHLGLGLILVPMHYSLMTLRPLWRLKLLRLHRQTFLCIVLWLIYLKLRCSSLMSLKKNWMDLVSLILWKTHLERRRSSSWVEVVVRNINVFS